ncbi:CPBP family intramembrane glutamic endopeptidase [Peptococcus simiae]|uniref:CPBP family intramembrane glutamic endopeptidase n=1 Tax=Peptococcus simiae TaxID=1643805 RepID=UPI00398041EB
MDKNPSGKWLEALCILVLTYVLVFASAVVLAGPLGLADTPLFLITTFVQQGILLGLVAVMLRRSGRHWADIGLRPISARSAMRSIAAGGLILIVMAGFIQVINLFLPDGLPAQNVEAFFHMASPRVAFAISFILMVVAAPIVEELFFRGYLYQAFAARLSPQSAMLVTSLIFGLVHGDVYRLLPLAVGGYFLNLVAVRERTILASMFAHAAWNAVMLLVAFGSLS